MDFSVDLQGSSQLTNDGQKRDVSYHMRTARPVIAHQAQQQRCISPKMSSDALDVTEIANKVSDDLEARVFVYSGEINDLGLGLLIKEMQITSELPYKPNTILLLTTLGGQANPAYKIARLLQDTSSNLYICIPALCKSAGTLIALGASKLIMTRASELGPLDVQLLKRDEIGQRRSGLVVRTAFEGLADESFAVFEKVLLGIKARSGQSISFETASRIAANIASNIMTPVYAQINPDDLGNDLRDLNVATAYGERLAEHGTNATPQAVKRLVSGYPSHDFIIDYAEASQIFSGVEEPSKNVNELIFALGRMVYVEQDPHVVRRLDRKLSENQSDGPGGEESVDGAHVAVRRPSARRSGHGKGAKK